MEPGDPARAHVAGHVAPLALGPHQPRGLHRQRATQERHSHVAAHAGAAPLEEGRRHRERQHRGAVEVDRGPVHDLGITGLPLLHADPGHGLQDLVVPGAIPERPAITVSGQRAVDQARVDRLHPVVVDAEPRGDRGPEVVHQDVRALHQPSQHGEPVGMLQVETDAVLVAIDSEERAALVRQRRGVVAQVVALGRLDLDDLGAEVAQQGAAIRARHVAAQVEHGDTAQGALALAGAERRRRGHARYVTA